jgi:uncharacterized membrane protein
MRAFRFYKIRFRSFIKVKIWGNIHECSRFQSIKPVKGIEMKTENLVSRQFDASTLAMALKKGWVIFILTRPISVSFSMIFALIGLLILIGIEQAGIAPMMLPVAGGFMLIGPLLLSGFFSISDRLYADEVPVFADIVSGFSRLNREMLALGLVCMLLFMIWMTDAATLYGFIVGRTPTYLMALLPPPESVWSFVIWSSIIGAVLAFVIFAVSAFSVPLLYYRRAPLVRAVVLSVRTVFSNLFPSLLWAFLLASSMIASILILPLFLITFPVLAFASHSLYREIFPD